MTFALVTVNNIEFIDVVQRFAPPATTRGACEKKKGEVKD